MQVEAGARVERDRERIAEGVRKEKLGGGEHPVPGPDGQHAIGILMAREQGPVTVDGGLGRSRRPEV